MQLNNKGYYGPPASMWYTMFVLAIVGLTFGVWKIIELLIYVFSHLQWR